MEENLTIVNNIKETRFQAVVGGHLALLDYQIQDGRLESLYVFVPPAQRGRGLGGQLVEAALAFAKVEGLRVVPICSYARAYMESRG